MSWTVKELIEALDEFGNHVEVKLVIARGDAEYTIEDFEVGGATRPGEVFTVELSAELP